MPGATSELLLNGDTRMSNRPRDKKDKLLLGLLGLVAVLLLTTIIVVAAVAASVQSDIQAMIGKSSWNVVDIATASSNPATWYLVATSAASLFTKASKLDFAVDVTKSCDIYVSCYQVISEAACRNFEGVNKDGCTWENGSCNGEAYQYSESLQAYCSYYDDDEGNCNDAQVITGPGCSYTSEEEECKSKSDNQSTVIQVVCTREVSVSKKTSDDITEKLKDLEFTAKNFASSLKGKPATATDAVLDIATWLEKMVNSDFSKLGQACATLAEAVVNMDLSGLICTDDENPNCSSDAQLKAYAAIVQTMCSRLDAADIRGSH